MYISSVRDVPCHGQSGLISLSSGSVVPWNTTKLHRQHQGSKWGDLEANLPAPGVSALSQEAKQASQVLIPINGAFRFD